MFQPSALKKGDKIGIVAPAGKIAKQKILTAQKVLESLSYEVILGKHIFDEHHIFAGTDKDRAKDFQFMLDHEEVKAILCARGGYGSIRIIDKLRFDGFEKHPKLLIGFSDITIFHARLNHLHFGSLHATMPINFTENLTDSSSLQKLTDYLEGKITNYQIPHHNLNRSGSSEAELVGGNLSIICSLNATDYELNTHNRILFIEDLNEDLYHLDRLMLSLKLSGKLAHLEGLIIGGMSDMKDGETPFGKTAYEIIKESVQEYNFPVIFDFPAGHIDENWPLPLGKKVKFEVSEKDVKLSWKN
ncbi:LD-carboxypeptidase [Ancylomarina euxinus]|uniref:LD-carboxypeptidase n=1 Tax=Ancylomarina euxinus TaxID=2283627 RepID=A0A425XZT5_9BACT|nr:LD-carboxypeptidase [Ancylomarina euxinus]MCZ4695473.1 LD-carboxypeptidase [Ancylomarina euxinus]MUP15709.1 LD-carboxypeptidase [Ancylomarina euxinus]RRG20701.1 LD-carboxypeptidase [Ancylomarina euxinus]